MFEERKATKEEIINFYLNQIKMLVITWWQAVKEMVKE